MAIEMINRKNLLLSSFELPRYLLWNSKNKKHAKLSYFIVIVAGACSLIHQMRPPFVGFIRILVLVVFVSACCSSTYGSTEKEKTLAIIKPDGLLGNYTDDIKRTILECGFRIFKEKVVQLDEATGKRFYAEHSSKSFFSSLITYMSSGPVLVMVLEKDNAIADWRALMGPTDASKAKITHPHSIRARCGLDTEKNCVHGSDSPKSALREIPFFFRELSADVNTEHDEL